MKPLYWIASSKKDLRAFPEAVKDVMGRSLLDVQFGETPDHAIPLRGFGGAGVLELLQDYDGDTYRAVYTEVHRCRVRAALLSEEEQASDRHAEARPGPDTRAAGRGGDRLETQTRRVELTREIEIEESSGNVFADLGLPDAEERLAKALLSRAIAKAVKARGLTQAQAAAILGTTQPKVSDVMRGNLGSFTLDRLIRYLTAFNMDVRIEVTPSASEGQTGQVQVELA